MSAKLVTNQGDRLKAVFESIRDYISEVRIIFREQGLEFVGQDSAKVVVFRYVIVAKSIRSIGGSYSFTGSRAIEVSVKTRAIAAHLRCSSPKDTISFEIDPATPERLTFNVQNSDKNSRADIILPIPDGPVVDVEAFDSLKWCDVVTMSSSLFHDMIRDLVSADPSPPLARLYYDGYTFRLTADGLMSKVTFTVSDKQRPAEGEEGEDATPGVSFKRTGGSQWPVEATYPISFMQRVSKAKNVCSKISILLRADYPVAFVYDTQIGILTYIISPRVEEDIGDTAPPPGANKRPPPASATTTYGIRTMKRRKPPQPVGEDSSDEEDAKKSDPSVAKKGGGEGEGEDPIGEYDDE